MVCYQGQSRLPRIYWKYLLLITFDIVQIHGCLLLAAKQNTQRKLKAGPLGT